jgi:four helix bundle protein
MARNEVLDLSFDFAIRIIETYKVLTSDKKEYVLSKQLLRSGTSIGANIREAVVAQSRREFIAKMNISLKEANETEYWLLLLSKTGYIEESTNLLVAIKSIIRLLTSIIKTSNANKYE